ncbi:hypothetical protein ACN9MZ_22020 [Pseudoduganella sp. S-14]|jgi:hypothetical protein|uniref:hypothetical protein n=1 Tax=Pseudoduganella sp. S-14 TaxID=3404065 RepID=UPI003CE88ECA
MNKVIFAAVCAILMSGCADMPTKETAGTGFKEETYTTTGSRIPRKVSSTARADAVVLDKDEVDRQVQSQGNINTMGR